MIERIARWWCRHNHTRITRPVHSHYICLECLRKYRVAWDSGAASEGTLDQRGIETWRRVKKEA